MVKFDYLPDGRVAGIRGTFSAFNEPAAPDRAHRDHRRNGRGTSDRRGRRDEELMDVAHRPTPILADPGLPEA
jgi:hypothetical protein